MQSSHCCCLPFLNLLYAQNNLTADETAIRDNVSQLETGWNKKSGAVFAKTTLSLKVRQIRFLRPDVAVVHVNGHRDGPTKELVQDALLTLVMTKEKEVWTVAAFQNTAVVGR